MNNNLHQELESEINKRNPTKTKVTTASKVYLLYCCTYNSCDHIGVFSSYSKANKIKIKLKTELNITANIEEFIVDNYNFKDL